MAQIAGFDSTVVPAGLGTEARQQDSAPDSTRVTPAAEGEAQRPDRRENSPEETANEFEGRVAFTTKFGPDETGFPLQLVRGDDLEAAVNLDIVALQNSRLSNANNDVVIRAQESEQQRAEPSTAPPPASTESSAAPTIETTSPSQDGAATATSQSGTTTDGGGTSNSDPGSVVNVQV